MDQPGLGKLIAELRKAKGLTQEELVAQCNLSVRTLQRIESGEVRPRSFTVKVIFTALDYKVADAPSQAISGEIKSNSFKFPQWIVQFYIYTIDVFNLKTNPMKKLSILAGILLLSTLVFSFKSYSQHNQANPLIGKWKLVQTANGGNKDSNIQKVDDSSARTLQFTPKLNFETRRRSYSIYNSGVYAMVNDSTFITVHHQPNGDLTPISNLYDFNISNDTLHFKGFYLVPAKQNGKVYLAPKVVNEWWVKMEDIATEKAQKKKWWKFW